MISLLTSSRSDGDISGEIAEIVGFDELDLATGLVQNRQLIVTRVSDSVSSLNIDSLISRLRVYLCPHPRGSPSQRREKERPLTVRHIRHDI